MKAIKCEMCGSNDVVKQDGLYVCQNCGTKYSVEEARKLMIEGTVEVTGTVKIDESQKVQTWNTFAETALRNGNFKEAYDYANKILELSPNFVGAWMIRMRCVAQMGTLESPRTSEVISIGKNIITLDRSKEEEIGLFYMDLSTQMLRSAFSLLNDVDKKTVLHNAKTLDRYCDQALELEHTVAGLSIFKNSAELQDKGVDFVSAFLDFSECFIAFLYELNPYDKDVIDSLNEKYEAIDRSLRKDFPAINYNSDIQADNQMDDQIQEKKSAGCYVATAVYGSYNCPEVWTLRRFRDNTLDATWYGRAFIKTYYAISPTLVKWFGDTEWFKKMWRKPLDRMVDSLHKKGMKSTPYQDKY